ncbi:nucleotide exchange factor GrpE [Thalassotalea crassostreae]|uniref:nucleotide exchange factor GrpE n=1 Tax=Thalassotalea crassostreae TaxID=1763536 RepID=UPI000838BA82|nr:nucleotide exchange factor GrpE [Thalassotalea crassostreae]
MTTESTNTDKPTNDENIEQNQADINAESQAVEGEVVDSAESNESAEQEQPTLSPEQEKIAELEQALAAAQATIDGNKDAVIRAKAEVDNMRRRSAQEVDKAKKFALEKFAVEMLTVVDNLERGLATIDAEAEEQKAIFEGVNLTLQGLISGLEKFAVTAIDPQDQPFNPELHQAMSMQEVEGVAANTVIAVMQKGYELNGRLIRPAMVMVSK